jgi:copper chaperone CopZ
MKERARENKGLEKLEKAPTNSAEQVDTPSTPRTISLPIWGMTCLSCARKIEEALSGCPGVAEAEVDFVTRKAFVTFNPAKVSPEALRTAVEASGYQVLERQKEEWVESSTPSLTDLLSNPRPYLIGAAAALGVVAFLAVGLGVQAILFSLLRAWHKGGSTKAAKCTLAASGGISTTAMAVCCSHYILPLLPALGLPFLSTAAASLADYQTYFFLVGVISNLFGIGLMIRMMDKNRMIQLGAFMSHLRFGVLPMKR